MITATETVMMGSEARTGFAALAEEAEDGLQVEPVDPGLATTTNAERVAPVRRRSCAEPGADEPRRAAAFHRGRFHVILRGRKSDPQAKLVTKSHQGRGACGWMIASAFMRCNTSRYGRNAGRVRRAHAFSCGQGAWDD